MKSRDWVALSPRFTPGWPWPEDSYGLAPMYGEDGWCRGCGTPLVEQAGPLFMQGSKFPTGDVWMPNWLFDVICVSAGLAEVLRDRFELRLGEVHTPRGGDSGARQIIPEQSRVPWRRRRDLVRAVRKRHAAHHGRRTGATCAHCKRWKWLPVGEDAAPILGSALTTDAAFVASSEVFGDGLTSYRHLLFRRPLGEVLAAASPRTLELVDVEIA